MLPSSGGESSTSMTSGTGVITLPNDFKITLNLSSCLPSFFYYDPPTPSDDLSIFENRLRTLTDGGWPLDFLTPHQIASAGLFYLGFQDQVHCNYCSNTFEYWLRGVDPLQEHKRWSPTCKFITTLNGYPPENKLTRIQDYLDSFGIMQQIDPPIFYDFATLEVRLKTFNDCSKIFKQDIHTLCEAGFFWVAECKNLESVTICFYCGKAIWNWNDDDEPWTEHAKLSSKCSYLLLNKGKMFVDKACELKAMLTMDNPTSTLENKLIINSTKKYVLQIKDICDISKIKISTDENLDLSQNPNPDETLESVMCKICYRAEVNVVFIPCGHAITCIQCAVTIDQCAICRKPSKMAMRIFLSLEERRNDKDLEQLPCSSSQCLKKKSNPILCKVCKKEEMQTVFLLCRHVYACVQCASKMQKCPVCAVAFIGTVQVYL